MNMSHMRTHYVNGCILAFILRLVLININSVRRFLQARTASGLKKRMSSSSFIEAIEKAGGVFMMPCGWSTRKSKAS